MFSNATPVQGTIRADNRALPQRLAETLMKEEPAVRLLVSSAKLKVKINATLIAANQFL
ncbi:hypothetical protein [Rhizobium laguerreae]|uniref:hypothetical protein n=1 Tax=Rhizobium laguerreae TaxID=1076926 RepID=UPI001C9036DB|nr:hypothetical protein [Rhizobium laguerreae]MBY3318602.1 hypothetical protein [Rhizobium laguerreae]MBY3361966.1 hypothetical protein [Rhizobium laguerreae]